jgi:hypothetical protein
MYNSSTAQGTLAMQCRSFQSFNVTNTGKSVLEVRGSLKHAFRASAGITGNTVTSWGATSDMPEYANLAAADAKYRIVSFGVHIFGIMTPTEAKGTVSLVTQTPITDDSFALDSEMYLDVNRNAMSGYDAYWVAKPSDIQFDFVDVANRNESMTTLTIVIDGSTAGQGNVPALGVEVIMNIEWYPELTSIYSRLSTPPHPAENKIAEAVTNTQSALNFVYNHLPTKEISQIAKGYLVRRIAGMMMPPQLRGASMLANAAYNVMEVD